jgi:hypothetical protein
MQRRGPKRYGVLFHRRHLRCRGSSWKEELSEEERRDIVNYVLHIVSLRKICLCRWRHDAGIVPKNIETLFLCEKPRSGGLDGC